jgi:hypothetical protein
MKNLRLIAVAIFVSFCGTVMANDSGENHQDYTNTRGPNPYFRGESYQGGGNEVFGHPVQHHHVVKPRVKK